MIKKTYAVTEWPEGKDRILETETGSTRSHSVKNSLWKRLLTCLKTDCSMNGCTIHYFQMRAVETVPGKTTLRTGILYPSPMTVSSSLLNADLYSPFYTVPRPE
jgi:hypothetical protein